MTSPDDDPFHELFRDVDTPLPLDSDFDERLWRQLDASLRRSPTSFRTVEQHPAVFAPGEVVRLDTEPDVRATRPGAWLAAAALALIVGVAAVLAGSNGDDGVVATDSPSTTLSPTEGLRVACSAFRADTILGSTALGDLSSALAAGTVFEDEVRLHLQELGIPMAAFRQAVEEIRTNDNATNADSIVAELGRIESWADQVNALDQPFDVDEASFLLTRLSWSILAANQPLAALGAGGCLR